MFETLLRSFYLTLNISILTGYVDNFLLHMGELSLVERTDSCSIGDFGS